VSVCFLSADGRPRTTAYASGSRAPSAEAPNPIAAASCLLPSPDARALSGASPLKLAAQSVGARSKDWAASFSGGTR
jgi:hypothetical protein